MAFGTVDSIIYGYKSMKSKRVKYKAEGKPFGVFRARLYDVRGLHPDSYGPGRPPEKAPFLDLTEHNQVTQVALNGFAKIVNGEGGFTGVPNYCAVGTGADDPSIADTQLVAEIGRVVIVPGSKSRTDNATTMQFYFGPTDGNGNIKEIGAYIDGTAVANSGTLFDRALLDIVKTNLNALFIDFTLTFSA